MGKYNLLKDLKMIWQYASSVLGVIV